jgi:hypothetical protein
MVIVKRSLDAANAIIAGNSVNLISSIIMASPIVVAATEYPGAGLEPVSEPPQNEKAPASHRSPLVAV